MTRVLSFEEIFTVMAAASQGHASARVPITESANVADVPTRIGKALNVLLDDLESRSASLRQSQGRLTALYQAGIIGIIVSTIDGQVLEVNDALLGALGYGRDEIGSGAVRWSSLTPPEWRDADQRAMQSLRACGVAGLREKEYLHKSGARVPVMVGSTASAESPDEIISFVLDLTSNKQAALAVQHLREVGASEARFRALLEAAPDAAVLADREGNIMLVNGQTEQLFGYARSELLGTPVERLLPERLRRGSSGSGRAHLLEPSRAGLALAALDLYGLRKDGREFPIEIRLSPLNSENGIVVYASIRDVSERRKAEEQRFRLAAIVDSSGDAIIGKTLSGIISSWNEGARRLFGYTADEIIGKSVTLLIPADRLHEEPEILARLARGERIEQFETVRTRKDGRDIHVSLTSSPVTDASGALIGASKIVRDITERRRAEMALAEAKEAAEAASRELETFSYSVAHDLRAPLRGMNGFAQVLLDTHADRLDVEGRDFLNEIVLNAQKMAELIDALLSLARTTRSELRRENVDLSALAREVTAELAFADPAREVHVVIRAEMSANADPRLARGLLQNLLGNAWKFTANAQPACIELGVEQNRGELAFFVRDNGAGFDMAFADKLFRPFQRLHGTAEFPGTGIGLATVQRIVHRHGGRIWAEAAVGAGATFYFTLPKRETETL
jgi:PAS domain S-box-containing protein